MRRSLTGQAGRGPIRYAAGSVLIALLGVLAPLSCAQAGDPRDHSTDLGVDNFGTLSQTCGFTKGGCGPTAATNSFTFLDNTDPFLGGRLTSGNPPGVAATLANLMQTDSNGSTFILNFIAGKQAYFSDLGISASFSAQVDPQLLTPAQQAAAPAISGTVVTAPTGIFLANELHDHEDVEMLANKINPDGSIDVTVGHYVTIVDLNWYDQNENGVMDQSDWASPTNHGHPTFGYMDPFGGVLRDGIELTEQNGHLTLFGPLTGNQYEVTALVSESPTPEPTTWAMLLLGFGGLGMVLRSTRRRQTIGTP